MNNLQEMMNEAFDKISNDGLIEKLIKEQIEKTVAGIIEDTFRSYSDFGKGLKEYIKNHFNFSFDKLSLPEYNATIIASINDEYQKQIASITSFQIKERLESILKPIDKQDWKLSEFVEKFGMSCIEYDDYDLYEGFEITAIYENRNDGYFNLYLDMEEGKSSYSCKYKIMFNEKGIWGLYIDNEDITIKQHNCMMYDFDRFLYQFYAQGCVVSEIDSFDTYISGNKDY